MTTNKYLEKIAKSSCRAGDEASRALSSRVSITSHGITPQSTGPKIEKRSIMEKRALSAVSKGFKFPKTTSGVGKTNKPKPLKVETKSAVPTITHKIDNPNKNLLKAAGMGSALKKAKTFASNVAAGAGKTVAESSRDIVQHAGGKKIRDWSKDHLKVKGNLSPYWENMKDADKLKRLTPEKKKQLKTLIQKRDASRVALGVAGTVGTVKGVEGVKAGKRKLDERRKRKLVERYYKQQGMM